MSAPTASLTVSRQWLAAIVNAGGPDLVGQPSVKPSFGFRNSYGDYPMTEYNINSQFTYLNRFNGTTDGKRLLPMLNVMDKKGCPGFMKDMPVFEANMGILHRLERTTSTPPTSRTSNYEGQGDTHMTTQIVDEPVIHFQQRSSIAKSEQVGLLNFSERRNKYRRIAIATIIEDVVDAIFNDARTSGPKYLNGLAQRCKLLSYPGHTTASYPYVWDNGGSAGTGYLTSAYLVEWGEEACHGLAPSGAAAGGTNMGVQHEDHGLRKVQTAVSPQKAYDALEDTFDFFFGLATNDDRKFTRIANIETRTSQTTGRFNEDVIIRAKRHGSFDPARTRMYVNSYLAADIDIRAKNRINGWNVQQVFGEDVTTFLNIPVRVIDDTIITATETAVS